MGISQRLRDYLDSHDIDYEVFSHPRAFPSQEVAHALHVSGKRLAKAVVMDADGKLIMAILPAAHRLDIHELQSILEARRLEMLPESELEKAFPDCERGAIPPFGNLYGLEVIVDRAVADMEELISTAGTHTDSIRMKYSAFAHLEKPRVSRFSEIWVAKAA